MKIVELRAENVKRLQAVQITPEGSVVVVGGKNGAGKSSVLDSIVYALNGAGSLPGKPVRRGEENAEIEITIDSEPPMIVRRRIRDDGKTDLEIRQVDANGKATAKLSKPQDVLDKLYGTIAFDPLAFTKLKHAAQVDMLRTLVGIDLADLEATEKRLFDERTEVNRDAKRLDAQLAGMPTHKDAPAAEVSSAAILSEIEDAQEANASIVESSRAIEELQRRREGISARIGNVNAQIDECERRIAELEAEKDTLAGDLNHADDKLAMDKELNAALVPVSLDPLKEKLAAVEMTNAKVRANAAAAAIAEQHAAATEQAEDLTNQIEECRAERLNRLAAAKWPVDGLAFGDSGVTFNGLPFDQCSSAEQLRIATGIGLAQHPQLRVLLIRDGSLLDDESLAAIAELAAEHDGQVWLERVGKGEECSVIIEDGSVAAPKKQKELVA
jgi:DNA repair exonuclease SbcCD ATPase subunit